MPKRKTEIFHFLVEKNIELNQMPNVSLCFIFNKNKTKLKDRVTKLAWRKFAIYTCFPSVLQNFPGHTITEYLDLEGNSRDRLG